MFGSSVLGNCLLSGSLLPLGLELANALAHGVTTIPERGHVVEREDEVAVCKLTEDTVLRLIFVGSGKAVSIDI